MFNVKMLTALTVLTLSFSSLSFGCTTENDESSTIKDQKLTGKVLIAYFSRADENYSVGNVEKGNTEILAEMIQEGTNGTLFHIQRSIPYPASYNECTVECRKEKGSRPTLLDDIDIKDYDIVFLGYPIWYSDMPMPVYTFIESKNWNGKKIIPFSTNEGSGLAGTISTIKEKCKSGTVIDALSMRGNTAQNSRERARIQVKDWLNSLDIENK